MKLYFGIHSDSTHLIQVNIYASWSEQSFKGLLMRPNQPTLQLSKSAESTN